MLDVKSLEPKGSSKNVGSPPMLIIIEGRMKQKHYLVTDVCMRRLNSDQLPSLNPYFIKPAGNGFSFLL